VTLSLLVNGVRPPDLAHALGADDRGIQYGDGLFETALLKDGKVRFLEAHLIRLYASCERLRITAPERVDLLADIATVTQQLRNGVLKITVTRGAGGRGYRPAPTLKTTRMVAVYAYEEQDAAAGITTRWCTTPLARNRQLAGMKHLNRLEQVLAQSEWNDAQIGEGLMLDTEGELVCATASNVFLVREGGLVTPDLRFCGVRGVMRAQVLQAAAQLHLPVSEEPLWPHDLEAASEVFVTNAVRGIRSVVALESVRWETGPIAQRLAAAIGL
jgi:4-amino-4-deoxychorismate lyase